MPIGSGFRKMRRNKGDKKRGDNFLRNISWEEKLRITILAMSGLGVTKIARRDKLSRQTIYRWIRELKGFAQQGWEIRRENYYDY